MEFKNDALSILKPWTENNQKKVKEYVISHSWLKADILKFTVYVKANNIITTAITDKWIYGIDSKGVIYCTGRGNLGIQDNFT